MSVTYERTGDAIAIDATTGIHVYRILQEALSNVARHAGDPRAWVRLRSTVGRLELEVEDHGRGMPAHDPPRGLGVVAIRERASLLGGTLDFLSRDGGGTIVRLRIPLSMPAESV